MQVLTVHWIEQIDRHAAECDEYSSPESISDTKNWLTWNGDLDNLNDSKDDREADHKSDIDLDYGSDDSETPEHRNVSAAQNVPRMIRPIGQSKKKVEKALITVDIMEARRNKGNKKK